MQHFRSRTFTKEHSGYTIMGEQHAELVRHNSHQIELHIAQPGLQDGLEEEGFTKCKIHGSEVQINDLIYGPANLPLGDESITPEDARYFLGTGETTARLKKYYPHIVTRVRNGMLELARVQTRSGRGLEGYPKHKLKNTMHVYAASRDRPSLPDHACFYNGDKSAFVDFDDLTYMFVDGWMLRADARLAAESRPRAAALLDEVKRRQGQRADHVATLSHHAFISDAAFDALGLSQVVPHPYKGLDAQRKDKDHPGLHAGHRTLTMARKTTMMSAHFTGTHHASPIHTKDIPLSAAPPAISMVEHQEGQAADDYTCSQSDPRRTLEHVYSPRQHDDRAQSESSPQASALEYNSASARSMTSAAGHPKNDPFNRDGLHSGLTDILQKAGVNTGQPGEHSVGRPGQFVKTVNQQPKIATDQEFEQAAKKHIRDAAQQTLSLDQGSEKRSDDDYQHMPSKRRKR
ncbi:hypothetical protein LTR53_001218 [Teratosphaeriaceae sp. CCFEE 6253]|nr:hypothetical protein LTR53_001218 [Teratosphaeriaceae sp. CCFEE 6253]